MKNYHKNKWHHAGIIYIFLLNNSKQMDYKKVDRDTMLQSIIKEMEEWVLKHGNTPGVIFFNWPKEDFQWENDG